MIDDLSLLVAPKIGVLGILRETVERSKAEAITRTLKMSCKMTSKYWVYANPPMFAQWVAGVNGTLKMEKYTYIHRDPPLEVSFHMDRLDFLIGDGPGWAHSQSVT